MQFEKTRAIGDHAECVLETTVDTENTTWVWDNVKAAAAGIRLVGLTQDKHVLPIPESERTYSGYTCRRCGLKSHWRPVGFVRLELLEKMFLETACGNSELKRLTGE